MSVNLDYELCMLPIDNAIRSRANWQNNTLSFEGAKDIAECCYKLGRVAEPTAAEIEAAAKELFIQTEIILNFDLDRQWLEEIESVKNKYRKNASIILEAAREAVTE